MLVQQTLVASPALKLPVGALPRHLQLAIMAGRACVAIADNNKLRGCAALCVVISGILGSTCAHSGRSELVEPPVCSAFDPERSALSDKCEISFDYPAR